MKTNYLDTLYSPDDLKGLSIEQLTQVAHELRSFLIESVLNSGGHFASGLGVVELTVALHHIFDTPYDQIIWDVGHQAYPHKILTKRKDQIHTIRKQGGLNPFPTPFESEYDAFGVGHSSTSISAALGMAIAAAQQGEEEKQLIAVIGDGALTAGQAFEALNHAGDIKANILVILNDNKMSISPNVGALNKMLTRTLSNPLLQSVRTESAKLLERLPFNNAVDIAKKTEEQLKSIVAGESTIFEEFGFQYFGPIDGHDLPSLVSILKNLKQKRGPRFLHITTQKGRGYAKAEEAPVTFHAVSAAKSGAQSGAAAPKPLTYTQVFSNWLCKMAEESPQLVGITPAMREGSGLVEFSQRFPDRYFDTAIAEQHAVTLAAGMAIQGLKPVVAIYSTFLQRAYDQLIHDVALQNLPVLFAIDRAGIVGPDGATHSGSFDLAYLRSIPNMTIMAPSDEAESYAMLTTGYRLKGPAAVRYPRGAGIGTPLPDQLPEPLPIGKAKLHRTGERLLIISVGAMLPEAKAVAEAFNGTLLDLRFIKPLDDEQIIALTQTHTHLITIEDGSIMGGAGSAVAEMLNQQGYYPKIRHFGLADHFPEHGERHEVLSQYGLDKRSLIEATRHFLAE